MFPVLIEIFGIEIHTYGVLVALGVIVGYILALKLAKKEGIHPNAVDFTVMMAVIFGILGARIAFIIEHPEEIKNITDLLAIWKGGVSFYGAFIGGVLGVLIGIYRYKIPVWSAGDVATPSLALAHAIGRLGCTSAGCCYGKPVPVDGPLDPGIHLMDKFPYFYVVFPPGATAPPFVPLYPTQIMEFTGNFIIFLILLLSFPRRPFKGFVFSLYLILYGTERFALEFFRGVTPPIEPIGLTWNQVVSALLVITGILLFFLLSIRNKSVSHGS